MTEAGKPVVLVAEDEPSVAEGYELWLSEDYEVRLAADGRAAVDAVDDSVDVVLLDRMMPKLSGKEVLAEIRRRDVDCRVAMVTAVEPDFEVVEMGFDAYVTKPPDRQELIDTIEDLLGRAGVDDAFQEYYSLMARKTALQERKPQADLEDSEEYRDLLERIEAKRRELDEDLGDMSSDLGFVSAVRGIADDDDDLEGVAPGGGDPFQGADR